MSPFDHVKAVRSIPSSRLRGAERMVLLILATHCNADSVCWPSVETLAEECGLTTRGVRKGLASLREKGLLEDVRRGPKGVNVVHLNLVHPEPRSPLTLNHVPSDPEPRSAKESREGSNGRVHSPPTPSSRGGSRLDRLVEALAKGVEEQGYVPTWWLDPSPHDLDVMVESCRQHGLTGDRAKIREAMRLVALEA